MKASSIPVLSVLQVFVGKVPPVAEKPQNEAAGVVSEVAPPVVLIEDGVTLLQSRLPLGGNLIRANDLAKYGY